MPTEASLRLKLNKKLKISTGKSKKFKTQHAIDGDQSHEKQNGEKKKFNSSRKDKKVHRGREQSDEEVYKRGKREPMSSDGKKKLKSNGKDKKVYRGSYEEVYKRGKREPMNLDGKKKLKSNGKDKKVLRGREGSDEEVYKRGKREPMSLDGKKKLKSIGKDKKVLRGREGSDKEVYEMGRHEPLDSDRKRKRIYAEKDVNFDSVKQKSGGKSRSMWVSSNKKDAASEHRYVEESAQVSNTKRRGKEKEVDRVDSGQKGSLNKQSKSKSDVKNNLDASQKKFQDKSPSLKTKVRDKKSFDDDSEVLDDKPKKKKRVIRIDPYDISNKRLDDGLVIDETAKKKDKDLEKKDEMSKNAQFRAIQPNPSILAYVEDNLLGRRRLIELRRAGYNTELSAPLDNIPFSNPERERIEENIFRNKLTFFAAAKVSSSFPPPDFPEIAFAGRSNVGKSSLLNALTRQWGVVRTSDKPGLTQTINFFNLGSKLSLVDLPGYGFAYAKEEVKDAWEELVKKYVSTRVGLKRVCLLIDTKWGMKPRDYELIHLMERSQTKYQIVLTKTDMVFPIDLSRRAMQIEESLKANRSIVQPVMMVSSKTGAGIRSLRTVLTKIARFAKV